jgi:hypothetical protein
MPELARITHGYCIVLISPRRAAVPHATTLRECVKQMGFRGGRRLRPRLIGATAR